MTPFTFFETLMGHLVFNNGNAYGLIEFDGTTPTAIWPMRPDRVQVNRDRVTKQLVYSYHSPSSEPLKLPAYRVLHIPGLGYDGMIGYTPLTMARQSIGLALAAEDMGARLFGQGTNTGGFLKHPKVLTDNSRANLKKSYDEQYKGIEKSHGLMILEEGMEYQRSAIPPEDAQFLQSRQFQVNEIARFFHVPPHMIGDLERATFGNIEQQSLEFVVYTMRPWLIRWEQALNWKLLAPYERPNYFFEFLVDGLLRGDFESRMRGYWTSIQAGILSPNEARELDNRNARPEGDIYLQPANMVPSGWTPPKGTGVTQ